MNDRFCIVTRQSAEPDSLVRFVAGPDSSIVPDLKRNLPGRGCWVTADRVHVDKAVAKKLFARALKTEVKVPGDSGRLSTTCWSSRRSALSALPGKPAKSRSGQPK